MPGDSHHFSSCNCTITLSPHAFPEPAVDFSISTFALLASGPTLNVMSLRFQPVDTTDWVADVRKAEGLLGWTPRHTLAEGLAKTVAWFERRLDSERGPSER